MLRRDRRARGRMALRIGCVKYLNARPLIRGWPGHVDFDHPSALCKRLAGGELDIALVSSLEFLRNPIYRIVDNISISSHGPVYSVVIAHQGKISELDEIELDPAAKTSTDLLRCLLAELNLAPRFILPSTSSITDRRARLFIGDQAIRFRENHRDEFHFWDLGEEWQKIFDVPFVYALWLIRPEVVEAKRIASRLRKLRDENLARIDDLIGEEKGFDHDFCHRYYGENLRFSFGEKEREGLSKFYKRCVKLHLLPHPDLGFGAWDLELARRCV
jgi:Predicted periplasmic solute-binding protein